MRDALAEILAKKWALIECAKAALPEATLLAALAEAPPLPFAAALERHLSEGRYGLIAEIKKASPSAGLIRGDFDPFSLARAYAAGGASCLSVLTDTPYFQGSEDDLVAARRAVELPVLRKDFILDPYQILESRYIGADCVLLIMAALSDAMASELAAAAAELGLDVLAEVLGRLGSERAWVVHGSGLDELTTAGVTTVASLEDGKVETFEIVAEEIGLPRARIEDLRGGAPPHNARLMRDLLAGAGGPLRDIVLLNSGAALVIAGRASTLEGGIELAARSLDSGAARRALEHLVTRTNMPIEAEAAAK